MERTKTEIIYENIVRMTSLKESAGVFFGAVEALMIDGAIQDIRKETEKIAYKIAENDGFREGKQLFYWDLGLRVLACSLGEVVYYSESDERKAREILIGEYNSLLNGLENKESLGRLENLARIVLGYGKPQIRKRQEISKKITSFIRNV